MKPAAFDYLRAASVPEALAALRSGQGQAKLVAGGQSLGPMLNLRLVRPGRLVDIAGVAELNRIEASALSVRIGACVSHARLEDEASQLPGLQPLAHVARGIAYRGVRNRGTIGGSLAHADPAADWPLVLATWGAQIELQSPAGTRQVAADTFVRSAYATALTEHELIAAVQVPRLSPSARWVYRKFCRKPGEFAEAAVAALFDPERSVARIFIGAPAARPTALHDLAAQLAREGAHGLDNARVGECAAQVLPEAPAARRHACIELLRRALAEVLS